MFGKLALVADNMHCTTAVQSTIVRNIRKLCFQKLPIYLYMNGPREIGRLSDQS